MSARKWNFKRKLTTFVLFGVGITGLVLFFELWLRAPPINKKKPAKDRSSNNRVRNRYSIPQDDFFDYFDGDSDTTLHDSEYSGSQNIASRENERLSDLGTLNQPPFYDQFFLDGGPESSELLWFLQNNDFNQNTFSDSTGLNAPDLQYTETTNPSGSHTSNTEITLPRDLGFRTRVQRLDNMSISPNFQLGIEGRADWYLKPGQHHIPITDETKGFFQFKQKEWYDFLEENVGRHFIPDENCKDYAYETPEKTSGVPFLDEIDGDEISEESKKEIREYFARPLDGDESEVDAELEKRVHETLRNLPLTDFLKNVISDGNIPMRVHCRLKRIPISSKRKEFWIPSDPRYKTTTGTFSNIKKESETLETFGTAEKQQVEPLSGPLRIPENDLCRRIRNDSVIRKSTGRYFDAYLEAARNSQISDLFYNQYPSEKYFVDLGTVCCDYKEVNALRNGEFNGDDRELLLNVYFTDYESFTELFFTFFEKKYGICFPQDWIDVIYQQPLLVPVAADKTQKNFMNPSSIREIFVRPIRRANPLTNNPLDYDVFNCKPNAMKLAEVKRFLKRFGPHYSLFMNNLLDARTGIFINNFRRAT